jgi:hypothetical protein
MLRNIGLDCDGDLEILIPRGTEVPHEFNCHIHKNGEEYLSLYEGNYVRNEHNVLVGRFPLKGERVLCTLRVDLNREIKIYLDEKIVGSYPCNSETGTIPVEPRRIWLDARNEFRDYIQSTALFVSDPMVQEKIPEWKWVLQKLDWAKEIMEYEVTSEEYKLALQQIEHMVNPFLEKCRHQIHRQPLSECDGISERDGISECNHGHLNDETILEDRGDSLECNSDSDYESIDNGLNPILESKDESNDESNDLK